MSEQASQIIGHAVIRRLLRSALENPAPSYLFVGPAHVGKRTVAERFIRELLGLSSDDPHWMSHPDLIFLRPEEGKKQVSVEQVRDLRERISLRPSRAPRVVAYVPFADRLNESGTNALLKVVEEPPAGAVFVFVAEDLGRIPGTLRSRSVLIPFSRVSKQEIVDGLLACGTSKADADRLATASRGAPGLALEPVEGPTTGSRFTILFMDARSAGSRLAAIEDLAKTCEAEEDAASAWKDALLQAMQMLEPALTQDPSVAGSLGIALIAALRLTGSSALSPRVPLEACAARLAGDPKTVFAELQPRHIASAFSALYHVTRE